MRFVIQRVTEATCEVDQKITGQITNGFCVLIGIALIIFIVDSIENKFTPGLWCKLFLLTSYLHIILY